MTRIQVTIKKKNTKSLESEIKEFIIPLSERQMYVASEETVSEIRRRIAESIQRPGSTGNLASGFFAEKILNGYGIGNINSLNQKQPYWHWIEYGIAQTGRTIPPGFSENKSIAGTFKPGIPKPTSNDFRGGRFQIGQRQSAEGGVYPLEPTRPIEPHNYIEKTISKIPEIINNTLNTVK